MTKIAKTTTRTANETEMRPLKALTGKPYFHDAFVTALKEAAIAKGYQSPKWATMKQWNSMNKSIAKNEHATLVESFDVQEQRTEDGIEEVRVPKKTWLFNECQLQGYRQ
jgi:antirestriction protein ArdC